MLRQRRDAATTEVRSRHSVGGVGKAGEWFKDGEENGVEFWKGVEGIVLVHGWRVDLAYEAVLANGNIGKRMVLDRYVDSPFPDHPVCSGCLLTVQKVPSMRSLPHVSPLKVVRSSLGFSGLR